MGIQRISRFAAVAVCSLLLTGGRPAATADWPPPLPGAKDGVVTLRSDDFLKVPESVVAARSKPGTAEFTVVKSPPTIELAYHANLGEGADQRRLWSSWGDICVATDGRVYCGIGDHGDDAGGDARCFIYCWDPEKKRLTQVVDVNSLLPQSKPHSRWSKIHAKIDEGKDGLIYFSGTLNDGNRAGKPQYAWSEQCPGGQLYRYDPKAGKAEVFASLPPRRCTATSLLDWERNLWWCNLEAGDGNALFAVDLATGKVAYQGTDGTVGFNRNFALARDGAIVFNAPEGLAKLDPASKQIVPLAGKLGESPGMRCSTGETKAGEIFGITHGTSQLFCLKPATGDVKLLGPNWLAGSYTAVCALSPDERFLYYLPGSHGGAFRDGTPVVQYEIATGQRKVLAFLAEATERECGYVPAGTYGMKVSADGSTLYVNFNGHAADRIRPSHMKPIGFGLTAFAAIHIPAVER